MPLTAEKVAYPHIVSSPEIAGGIPILEGSRIPVSTLIHAHQLGMDFDEILMQYPSLRPEQLHAAFLYYFDHQTEIDDLLEEENQPIYGARIIEI